MEQQKFPLESHNLSNMNATKKLEYFSLLETLIFNIYIYTHTHIYIGNKYILYCCDNPTPKDL